MFRASSFDSRDCVDVILDGPSDPLRPVSPEMKKLLMAERDRIAYWQEWRKQQAEQNKSSDPPNKNGS